MFFEKKFPPWMDTLPPDTMLYHAKMAQVNDESIHRVPKWANTSEDLEYYRYVVEHIESVRLVWEKFWRNIDKNHNTLDFWIQDCEFFTIRGLIYSHDISKFGHEEWNGYRQWFYPGGGTEDKDMFARAWNHHQKSNPHHWQYWLMFEDGKTIALEMPFEYVIEMLCDWTAMSVKFKNLPSNWFAENRGEMLLYESTVSIIERWLPIFDEVYGLINKEV